MAAAGRQVTNTQTAFIINRNITDTIRIINTAIQLVGVYFA
jgi:ABC-type tungstate transport system substrate-binding protein